MEDLPMTTYAYIEPHCDNYLGAHDYTVHKTVEYLPYDASADWWEGLYEMDPDWPNQSRAGGCEPTILVEYDPVGPKGLGLALRVIA